MYLSGISVQVYKTHIMYLDWAAVTPVSAPSARQPIDTLHRFSTVTENINAILQLCNN